MFKVQFTRICSYRQNGEFTTCEHLYARSQSKALEWFRKDYPEHKDCILVAETIEEDLDNPSEWFKACVNTGCVHYF